jgi:hypothetical protein
LQRCASRASQLFASPTRLLTGQPALDEEETAEEEAEPMQDANAPSSSFNQSQLGQAVGTTEEGPRFKRTRSIKRVVEEANAIMGIQQDGDDFTTPPAATADTRRRKRARGNQEGDEANLPEAEIPGSTQRKKRIKDILVETETNGDSAADTPHARVVTPAAKRYNFRPTTM